MTTQRKLQAGVAAVVAVGLGAAGAAVAANKLNRSQPAVIAAAGSFVSSGSGPQAFGAGHGHPGRGHGDIADAASYLGITETALTTALESGKTLGQVADATAGKSKAGLIAALVAAEKKEIADDVAAGRLTQAQADTLNANLVAHETAEVNGTFRGGPGGRGPHGDHGDMLTAAASYLGVTQGSLIASLQSGKTLAQVADATSGKSKAGLVAALVAAEKAEIVADVKAGRLTQAQADQIGAGLEARVTAMVTDTRPPRGDGDRDGDHHRYGGPPPVAPAGFAAPTTGASI